MSNTHSTVRELLSQIVSPQNAENWWKPDLFEKNTRSKLPDGVVVVEPPPPIDQNYNCFVFALGLHTDSRFVGDEAWEKTRFLDSVFDQLIEEGLLQKVVTPEAGNLALYRGDGSTIHHAGVVRDDGRVISKWSLGPLLVHDVWVVPSYYGDDVSYWRVVEGAQEFVAEKLGV